MMDFISIPLTVGVVFFGTYKLFELFVRRRERILLIDKLVNNPNIDAKQDISLNLQTRNPYGALKIACLLIGIGIGLLVGFFINLGLNGALTEPSNHYVREIAGMIYGASVFVFGGISLLVAFIMEMKYSKEKEKRKELID